MSNKKTVKLVCAYNLVIDLDYGSFYLYQAVDAIATVLVAAIAIAAGDADGGVEGIIY